MSDPRGGIIQLAVRRFACRYGETSVRRAVPLGLGLLSISDPSMTVMETLSKLSHDADEQVSQNAILGLGLIGAGMYRELVSVSSVTVCVGARHFEY